jgi:hypothetical protein
MQYALVIQPDGTETEVEFAGSLLDAAQPYVEEPAVYTVRVGGKPHAMVCDDLGYAKALPLNRKATCLYGTGHAVLGTVVVGGLRSESG